MSLVTYLASCCNGRTMWFGFLAIRLITLYIAEIPWRKMYSDFHCDIATSPFCRKACFKAHFDTPMASIWTFTYILFIISVLLMELFSSHLYYNLIKVKVNKGALESPTGLRKHFLAQKDIVMDLNQQMLMLVLYLAYLLLRLHIEIAFLYILVMWHLPKVEEAPIVCSTWLCPGPYDCILQAAIERRVLVVFLCFISIVIICSCVSFAFYSICYYLVMGRSHRASGN